MVYRRDLIGGNNLSSEFNSLVITSRIHLILTWLLFFAVMNLKDLVYIMSFIRLIYTLVA